MSSPAELLDQLHGLVDQLLAIDGSVCSAAELRDLTVRLQAEQSRFTVAAASVANEWVGRGEWRADGSLRPQLALGRDAHRDHAVVRHELRRARWLERMPYTRRAVLEGRLSIDHVDLFVQRAAGRRFELFLQSEALLVEQCATLRLFDDARRVVQYWAALADDQLGLRRERSEASALFLSRSALTGEGDIHGHLVPIDLEIVAPELERLAREVLLEDRSAGVHRTPAQRRAAALVRMATRSINATGATARPSFQVIVGDETARRLCELASGTVVRPDDLEPFIDTAVMQHFLFDGSDVVLATSKQRTFRGNLRRAILVRDRRCQHESVCPTPAVDGDVDHRTPAARGGPTSQFNGASECIPHNRHPDLHGHPSPRPERRLTALDALRCRLRWQFLRELDDPQYAAIFGRAR